MFLVAFGDFPDPFEGLRTRRGRKEIKNIHALGWSAGDLHRHGTRIQSSLGERCGSDSRDGIVFRAQTSRSARFSCSTISPFVLNLELRPPEAKFYQHRKRNSKHVTISGGKASLTKLKPYLSASLRRGRLSLSQKLLLRGASSGGGTDGPAGREFNMMKQSTIHSGQNANFKFTDSRCITWVTDRSYCKLSPM